MAKKVTLGDLWVRGREIEISGPTGVDGPRATVKVWLQKMNPAEQDVVYRKARAKRSVVLMALHNTDSDEYLKTYSDVVDFGDRQLLVEYLVRAEAGDGSERAVQIEAETAAEEEWSKESYLEGLRQSWVDEMERRWLEDQEDPDAAKVFAELKRFRDQVNDRLNEARDGLRHEWSFRADPEVLDAVTKRFLETEADEEFLREYSVGEVWKGTRFAEDHSKSYFTSRDEVDALFPETLKQLLDGFATLNVAVLEGKDLPPTPGSSSSSDTLDEPETADASGLQVVAP